MAGLLLHARVCGAGRGRRTEGRHDAEEAAAGVVCEAVTNASRFGPAAVVNVDVQIVADADVPFTANAAFAPTP